MSEFGKQNGILDVASGQMAASSIILSKDCDKITAVDPVIIEDLHEPFHINCEKQELNESMIQDNKLIMGLYTCDATLAAIELAYKYNLPLYLQTCGCTHFPVDYFGFPVTFGFDLSYEGFIDYLQYFASECQKKYGGSKLEFTSLASSITEECGIPPYKIFIKC